MVDSTMPFRDQAISGENWTCPQPFHLVQQTYDRTQPNSTYGAIFSSNITDGANHLPAITLEQAPIQDVSQRLEPVGASPLETATRDILQVLTAAATRDQWAERSLPLIQQALSNGIDLNNLVHSLNARLPRGPGNQPAIVVDGRGDNRFLWISPTGFGGFVLEARRTNADSPWRVIDNNERF